MADLKAGGFQRVSSGTGSLTLNFGETSAHELHAWVLLVDPSGIEPDDLHPEALLRELIRVPLEPASGGATLYVPVGRALGVLLMARDADGRMVAPPDFEVREGAPVARSKASPQVDTPRAPVETPRARAETPRAPVETPRARAETPRALVESPRALVETATTGAPGAPPEPTPRAPGAIRTSRQGREIPLVFAQAGRGPMPDLASLAQRVATRAGVVPAQEAANGPSGEGAQRPNGAPSDAAAGRGPRPSAGFGVRQRWTLSRFAFAPSDQPRALVLRRTFIDEATLASFEAAPPPDAVPLPAGCDGLVDATSEDDAMVFYALLEGPGPWRPVPLTPLSPPFEESRRPYVLGDAATRLEPYLSQPPRSEVHAALLADVARVLAQPHEDRR